MNEHYRVIKHIQDNNQAWYGIHRCTYNDRNELVEISSNPIIKANSISELFSKLKAILIQASSKPVVTINERI